MRFPLHPPKVFISYRRAASVDLATRVRESLEALGVDVFQDYQDLNKGDFELDILAAIEQRVFVPILTPGTLDRCRVDGDPDKDEDPSDWILKEIRHAITHRCLCIPIFSSDFDHHDLDRFLPELIAQQLKKYNGIKVDREALFPASMTQVNKFLEPRGWVRSLYHPMGKRSLAAAATALLLIIAALIACFVHCLIYPPVIVLVDPVSMDGIAGWSPEMRIDRVALAQQDAWLAAENGLWRYRDNRHQFELVSAVQDELLRVTADMEDTRIGFVTADEAGRSDSVRIYDVVSGTVRILGIDRVAGDEQILGVTMSDDGTVLWLGMVSQGIWTYAIDSDQWTHIPINPTLEVPVNELVVDQRNANRVYWATNTASIYRRSDSETTWDLINSTTAGIEEYMSIRDLAVDAFGNLWIGTDNGLRVLFDSATGWDASQDHWIYCHPDNSAILSDDVIGLAVSDHGRYVWMVSYHGVNVVKTHEGRQACNCFQWYAWDATNSDDPFWTAPHLNPTGLDIVAEPGDANIAWVYKPNTAYVRIYRLDEE